jgi:hypothetical protein
MVFARCFLNRTPFLEMVMSTPHSERDDPAAALRTREHKNGQPVYVKMCGAQVSATERVCISARTAAWRVGERV